MGGRFDGRNRFAEIEHLAIFSTAHNDLLHFLSVFNPFGADLAPGSDRTNRQFLVVGRVNKAQPSREATATFILKKVT
jgi:hypothetical protein